MDDTYEIIKKSNPNKECKTLIVFDDMTADMLSNESLNPIVTELQQIAFNYTSDIDFIDFMNLYKKCNAKPYSFLVIDTTFASDNLLCFTKNLLERI